MHNKKISFRSILLIVKLYAMHADRGIFAGVFVGRVGSSVVNQPVSIFNRNAQCQQLHLRAPRMFTDDILLLLPQTYDIKRKIWRENNSHCAVITWTRFYFQRATKVSNQRTLSHLNVALSLPHVDVPFRLFCLFRACTPSTQGLRWLICMQFVQVQNWQQLRLLQALKHIFVEFFTAKAGNIFSSSATAMKDFTVVLLCC